VITSAAPATDTPRAVRNSVVVFTGHILSRLIDLYAVILLARTLGEAVLGQFSFAVVYVSYFAILIDLGFNITFVREMVRDKERQETLLTGMIIFKVALVAVGILLASTLILLGDYPIDTLQLVWIMTFALLISPKLPSLRVVYEQVFQAHLRMEVPTLIKLLDGGLLVALIYSIIFYGQPVLWVMVAYVACNLPGMIIILLASRKYVRPGRTFDLRLMVGLLRQALPIAVLGVFATLYSRLDILFLSLWWDETAIGYYTAAYRLTEAFRILPAAVLVSLYPVMVATADRIKEAFIPALSGGLKPLFILLIPVCIGTSFLTDRIIDLLYTSRYHPSGDALVILVWAELFVTMATVLSHALIALDRQRAVVKINGVMLLVNILVNVQLIPRWSFVGAGVARLVTEGVGVIGFMFILRRLTQWTCWRPCLPLLPGAAVLTLWLYLFGDLSLPLMILSSVVVYGAALFVTRGVTRAELSDLRTALMSTRLPAGTGIDV
ncbi:uncharacterized protein METZ01_LOCUS198314, partial [marine metagenome]